MVLEVFAVSVKGNGVLLELGCLKGKSENWKVSESACGFVTATQVVAKLTHWYNTAFCVKIEDMRSNFLIFDKKLYNKKNCLQKFLDNLFLTLAK